MRREINDLKNINVPKVQEMPRRDPRGPFEMNERAHDIRDVRSLDARDNDNQMKDPRVPNTYERTQDVRDPRSLDVRDPRSFDVRDPRSRLMQENENRGSRTPERIDDRGMESDYQSANNYSRQARPDPFNSYRDNINNEFESKKRKLDSANPREKINSIPNNYSRK